MRENDLIKEVQRSMNCLLEDEEIKSLMMNLVHTGMTPDQIAHHIREVIIKYLLLTDNY